MIIGLGIDLVEVPRIEKVLTKHQKRFLNRILTEKEKNAISRKRFIATYVAAYFATKEACSKALGTGLRGVSWKEMELLHEPSGKPFMRLHGRALERFKFLGGKRIHVSLSHERLYATAIVIIED
ncbi:holo-acyl-carrier-protein synthase [Thermodesulfatator indicus DSM 15286]|uniref:Holo-[acyl-carrier-protein] synthase n=1 Tax=Thermodesulfatator indicus (strain DSM 15286 / JCM 11887 / CIR29812) TaxID=667014 RepID=F8AA98_THEID|nr:holo-ACP synthase [Thermodesulfatator indicus]AEH44234.1 holo-acyl-carrier-protein synthase [Thermodesulfatator indicus DSM 15286]